MKPYFSDPANCERFIRVADSWVGTPWRVGPPQRMVGGDCVGIISAIYREVMGPPWADYLPEDHMYWHPVGFDADEIMRQHLLPLERMVAAGLVQRVEPVVEVQQKCVIVTPTMVGDVLILRCENGYPMSSCVFRDDTVYAAMPNGFHKVRLWRTRAVPVVLYRGITE